MQLAITPIYAIILTVFFIWLSLRVIGERRGKGFAYGDNSSPRIQAKIRAQANWAEYVPITLLLMLMAELQGNSGFWLHLTGVILTIGRVMHGVGMSYIPKKFFYRRWGMVLTCTSIAIAMVLNFLALF